MQITRHNQARPDPSGRRVRVRCKGRQQYLKGLTANQLPWMAALRRCEDPLLQATGKHHLCG